LAWALRFLVFLGAADRANKRRIAFGKAWKRRNC